MNVNDLAGRLAADRQQAKELRAEIGELERQRSKLLAVEYGVAADGDLSDVETKLTELRGDLAIIEARLPAGAAELRRLEAEQRDDTLELATAEMGAARVAWLEAKRDVLECYAGLDAARTVEAERHSAYRTLMAQVRAMGGHVTDLPALIGETGRQLKQVSKMLEVQA